MDFDFRFSGPVELAAAGVSIALFNQASRITIFPLVSITTSFVAEEDTVAKMKIKSGKGQKLKKGSDMLDDMENGVAKPRSETKEPALDDANDEAAENGKYLENDEDTENCENSDRGLDEGSEPKKSIPENAKLENGDKGDLKNSEPQENGTLSIHLSKINEHPELLLYVIVSFSIGYFIDQVPRQVLKTVHLLL